MHHQLDLYEYFRKGYASQVSSAVKEVTGISFFHILHVSPLALGLVYPLRLAISPSAFSCVAMAFMYAIVISAFAVLTGILFSSRAKRKSEKRKSIPPSSASGERRGAI